MDYLQAFNLNELKQNFKNARPINNKLIKQTFANFKPYGKVEHDFYIKDELLNKNIEKMSNYNNKNETKYGIFQQKVRLNYRKQNEKNIFLRQNKIQYSKMLQNKHLKNKRLENKAFEKIKNTIFNKYLHIH